MKLRAGPAFWLLATVACSSSEPGAGMGPAPEWTRALDALVGAPASYALQFAADPPDGTRMFVLLGGKCEAMGDPAQKSWIIGVALNASGPGRYEISRDAPDTMARTARAWVEEDGGERTSIAAVCGSLDVAKAAATIAEWKGAVRLQGKLSLSFPERPTTSLGCSSVEGAGTRVATCQCRHADGSQSSCTAEGERSCCKEDGPARLFRSFDIDAAPCPKLCAFPANRPDLARYCLELS